MVLKCKVKYHVKDLPKIKKIEQGDWIDLRAAKSVILEKGVQVIVPLGISMQLPKGYEAIIAPRSSSFKYWKILQTNGIGVIDESYCGNDDQWGMLVYPLEEGYIQKGDRICQFRIQKKMPEIEFEEVEDLGNETRGGFGSTGDK
jgi:dUTP pyrophosphatase